MRYGVLALIIALSAAGVCPAGEQPGAQQADPTENMSIEELRLFQGYVYASGGRDPLTMRVPTADELGFGRREPTRKAPTIEDQAAMLASWIGRIEDLFKVQDYEGALGVAGEATGVMDNEWPPIRAEHAELVRMAESVRNYNRLAARLKGQKEIADEFDALDLRIEGVAWSPTDAKTMVNGKMASAGEVLLEIRREGDLRIEAIEERGVVFQYRGMRFRLPVEIFSRLDPESAQ